MSPTPGAAGSGFGFVAACVALYAAAAVAIPSYFPLIEADSESYIQFSPTRSALYPAFLRTLAWLGLELRQVTYVQILLTAAALAILLPALLRAGLSRVLVAAFVAGLAANIFFVSLSHTIMTESLYLAVMMVAVAGWIDYLRTGRARHLALAALCVGLSIGIRPSGAVLVPMLAVSAWLKWHRRDTSAAALLVALVVPLAAAVALDRIVYRSVHNTWQGSVLSYALVGKAAMLARPDTSFTGPHANALAELNRKLSDAYAPVHAFLARIPSISARPVMSANFEAAAHFKLIGDDVERLSAQLGVPSGTLRTELARQAILANLPGYFRLTLVDYLAQWSIAGVRFPPGARALAAAIGDRQSLPLEDAVGQQGLRPSPTTYGWVVYPAFMIAGALTLILAALLMVFILRPARGDRPPALWLMLAAFFAASAHVNTLAISLVNVGNPRFLIAVYPQILLALLFAAQLPVNTGLRFSMKALRPSS